ncbi:hypothetical protein J2X72_003508 [Phyllobacterium sp. 1468]|uniref:hypothetical protein n=1 Tax=Phyllobacterium sp. 1468 TaxID=2817759 RepID=UPI002856B8FA|nr:hypothetical protein [Phyllobacterium sp. 1468]MDR6634696.1 hypothetical protein [Phyllobacterium sp. 1468]
MKTITSAIIAIGAIAFASGTALAACPDTTGSVKAEAQKGIAKDGSKAPLESDANSQTQTGAASTGTTTSSSEGQAVQKDGKTMPLANKEGGGDPNLATSQQDVTAQQKGDKTALAKAEDCKD